MYFYYDKLWHTNPAENFWFAFLLLTSYLDRCSFCWWMVEMEIRSFLLKIDKFVFINQNICYWQNKAHFTFLIKSNVTILSNYKLNLWYFRKILFIKIKTKWEPVHASTHKNYKNTKIFIQYQLNLTLMTQDLTILYFSNKK